MLTSANAQASGGADWELASGQLGTKGIRIGWCVWRSPLTPPLSPAYRGEGEEVNAVALGGKAKGDPRGCGSPENQFTKIDSLSGGVIPVPRSLCRLPDAA
jgi:hypothetical protein